MIGRVGQDPRCGLTFDTTGGPVVVISGLVGGSGATTLALALAVRAARESAAPVLLTDHHHAAGGVAALTGVQSCLGLSALARLMAEDRAPEGAAAELEHNVRLIATLPTSPDTTANDEHLVPLVTEARRAHGLVVIDAGPSACLSPALLRLATHVIWTTRATAEAAARIAPMLAGTALPPPGGSSEICVALAPPVDTVRVKTLRHATGGRCEHLVLTPYAPTALDDAMSRTLTAIARAVRRCE